MRCPYAAIAAFFSEHQLCRPGLDEPDVREALVALACDFGVGIAVRLPPVPARG